MSDTPSDDRPSTGMAAATGKAFAHVQHGMDRLTEWGLKKMRETGTTPPSAEPKNPHVRRIVRAGKGVLNFLGSTGEAYYRNYEELKRKRQRD